MDERTGLPNTVNEFDTLLDRYRRHPAVEEQVEELYVAVQDDEQVPQGVRRVLELVLSDD